MLGRASSCVRRPQEVTVWQQYALLGNSLSVVVVRDLVSYLLRALA